MKVTDIVLLLVVAGLVAAHTGQASGFTEATDRGSSDVLDSPEQTFEVQVDVDSGLIIAEHWELVRAHCSACHSAKLVAQNRGNRRTWLDMIRWMQDSQGLWQFDVATESAILDYLETNYGPSEVHRRQPINPDLMPDNPLEKVD
jgi:hypothetical protein